MNWLRAPAYPNMRGNPSSASRQPLRSRNISQDRGVRHQISSPMPQPPQKSARRPFGFRRREAHLRWTNHQRRGDAERFPQNCSGEFNPAPERSSICCLRHRLTAPTYLSVTTSFCSTGKLVSWWISSASSSKPAAESILRRKHFAKTPCRAFCGGERTGSLPEEKSERGLYARKNI